MTWKKHLRNAVLIVIVLIAALIWYMLTPAKSRVPLASLQGPTPELPVERREALPSINFLDVAGWQGSAAPRPAPGLAVKAFATGLNHPRWLHVLPNGDVLVAESTQPYRKPSGLMDRITKYLIKKANNSDKSANRITLLRDGDGDGVAEQRSVLLTGLNSPYGMQYLDGTLYVANTDALMAFPFQPGQTKITDKGRKLLALAANAPNNHWARNVVATPDGKTLLVTIGSNSNIAEGGMAREKDRAMIKQYDIASGRTVTYAYGLRNPNGVDFAPGSNEPWTVVNERDALGPDTPPDYLTSVDYGTFYGWPYTYWGQNKDERVKQERPDLLQYTKRPNYALGPHVAALGLAFNRGDGLGPQWKGGAFIAFHGSWNRSPPSGYEVVYIPFNGRGFPTGRKPIQVLGGFLNADGDAQGRPAGLAFDRSGALLVADDASNRIWRVTRGQPSTSSP